MKAIHAFILILFVPAFASFGPFRIQVSSDDSDGFGTCKIAVLTHIDRPTEADCAAHACDPQGGTCAPACNTYEYEQGHCPGIISICTLTAQPKTDRLCIECGNCDGHCHAMGTPYPVGTRAILDCTP